jgi:hypothetical protein
VELFLDLIAIAIVFYIRVEQDKLSTPIAPPRPTPTKPAPVVPFQRPAKPVRPVAMVMAPATLSVSTSPPLLDEMSVVELRELALALGFKGAGRWKRADLIDRIKALQSGS